MFFVRGAQENAGITRFSLAIPRRAALPIFLAHPRPTPCLPTLAWTFPAKQICASYCSTVAGATFAGVEDGTDCYCGGAGESYDKNGALGEESCATLCDSNPESTCGGLGAIEVLAKDDESVRQRIDRGSEYQWTYSNSIARICSE